jgi:outer membrane protein assembly factor BamD (BamD/ComL family)
LALVLTCRITFAAPAEANPKPVAAATDPVRAILDAGWQELRFANWPKAQEIFEEARGKAAKREHQAEAMFGLANLWQIRQPGGDQERARRLYEQIVGEFADTPAAPWAHLGLARLADTPEYEKQRNVELARKLYGEMIRAYPDHPATDEATLRLGMTYTENVGDRQAEDTGTAVLERRLAERPTNYLASAMHIVVGDVAQRRGNFRKAVNNWIAADSKGGVTNTPDRAILYFKIAHTAEHDLKAYALAAVWYERIVTDVKRDNRYYVSKLGAERCRRLAAESAKTGLPAAASAKAGASEARP